MAYLETSQALRELLGQIMLSECYLFIPFLKMKSQMSQTNSEKLVKRKIALKNHMTNTIATNFLWEQLTKTILRTGLARIIEVEED